MFCRTLPFFFLFLPMLWLTALSPLQAQEITGRGTTIAAPLYLQWAQEYKQQTGVTISYQPFWANAGKNIGTKRTDFEASDIPLNDAEMQAAPDIQHIPTLAHAVVLIYNLPGLTAPLRLTGEIIADIYLGNITHWNDPRLARINPGVALPDLAISPIHQSNNNGTTWVFTTYLSTVSPEWKERIGAGKSVRWPQGLGGTQDAGVAHLVLSNPGGFGYMELTNAMASRTSRVSYADIENARGRFVSPTVEATEIAAEAANMPRDLRGSLVNSSAPKGYPIVGCTYLFVYRRHNKPLLKPFLKWSLTEGQKEAATLGYAPLPPHLQKRALAAVTSLE